MDSADEYQDDLDEFERKLKDRNRSAQAHRASASSSDDEPDVISSFLMQFEFSFHVWRTVFATVTQIYVLRSLTNRCQKALRPSSLSLCSAVCAELRI